MQSNAIYIFLFTASASPGMLQQSRDVNMALVLISTVAMFVLCHTPRWEKRNIQDGGFWKIQEISFQLSWENEVKVAYPT